MERELIKPSSLALYIGTRCSIDEDSLRGSRSTRDLYSSAIYDGRIAAVGIAQRSTRYDARAELAVGIGCAQYEMVDRIILRSDGLISARARRFVSALIEVVAARMCASVCT